MMADLPGARQERFTTDDVQRREKINYFPAKSPFRLNLCNFSFFVLYYLFSFTPTNIWTSRIKNVSMTFRCFGLTFSESQGYECIRDGQNDSFPGTSSFSSVHYNDSFI